MDCCFSRASASACRVNTEPQNSEVVGLALRFAGSRGRLAGWRFPGASGLGALGRTCCGLSMLLRLRLHHTVLGHRGPWEFRTRRLTLNRELAVTARGS